MDGASLSHLEIVAGLVPIVAVAVIAGVLGATQAYRKYFMA